MADTSLILAESQSYYDLQAKEVQAKAFGAMLFTPDKDGNLGFVTDITTVPRVQYNNGSSVRIHTSDAFAYFFAEFLKENADELFVRTMQKATEMVRAQKARAAAEVASQLDLSQIDDSVANGSIPAPAITSPLLTVGIVGEPLTYYIIAANADIPSAPTTYEAKNLPAGLNIDDTTGVITGVVNRAGVYPVTIIAKNVVGKDQRVLQVTVANRSMPGVTASAAPTIFGALSATAQEGTPFTFACMASNLPAGNAGVVWAAPGLPTGLSIDAATGMITGTPDPGTAGTYPITLEVTTPGGTDTESLNLTVLTGTATTPTTTPPSITGPSTATAQEGVAVSISMAASNLPSSGTGVAWSATGLPSGLSINSTTGDITGTPASGTAGTHTVTVTVTTPDGTDTATLTITITV